MADEMKRRGSGMLLHITSLPSAFGVGDVGPGAYKFADFLSETKQSIWQILPLNPTDPAHGSSPYHSTSAFACNPLLISPELLVGDGLLDRKDLGPLPDFPEDRADYRSAMAYKEEPFQRAFERFKRKKEAFEFEQFCLHNANWLDDFALFAALKSYFGGKAWSEWPQDIRDRQPEALKWARRDLSEAVKKVIFLQYVFFEQWISLKGYCNERGIQIMGDIPIYVVYDSADLWTHPELFKLDSEKRPYAVAGVPPDYFSETGQLWGNPVYNWEVLKERGYDWWVQRIRHNLEMYDLIRIDHFRGFTAYWEIPVTEVSAVNGRWVDAPAWDFFNRITGEFPELPIIAEDLGLITPDVHELMGHFKFPGMKVLLFAFGDDLPNNPYAPHNIDRNCVVYTGTHDNNTARGWFEQEATSEVKERLFRYLGRVVPPDMIPRELVRLAMMSVADTAIFPLQDLLGLGEADRMNRPGTPSGNWEWRLDPSLLTAERKKELQEITEIYGRD